jgi:hypothetical protein
MIKIIIFLILMNQLLFQNNIIIEHSIDGTNWKKKGIIQQIGVSKSKTNFLLF